MTYETALLPWGGPNISISLFQLNLIIMRKSIFIQENISLLQKVSGYDKKTSCFYKLQMLLQIRKENNKYKRMILQ